MTKLVLISLENIQRIAMNSKQEFILDLKDWFDAQEDMEPTLDAIDGMDLWDCINEYISETEDEKSTD